MAFDAHTNIKTPFWRFGLGEWYYLAEKPFINVPACHFPEWEGSHSKMLLSKGAKKITLTKGPAYKYYEASKYKAFLECMLKSEERCY